MRMQEDNRSGGRIIHGGKIKDMNNKRMTGKFQGFGKLLYGGDYNPEQWLDHPEILEKDIELMKEAHINVVSLGIFSWASIEPEEGRYNFGWMEERIQTLYENGISVFLATPSGSKPKWMAEKYPEIRRVDPQGRRELYGGRHNHCYTSPVYRREVRRINMELARRFGDHPGVIAWHISNEYGGDCRCPLCQEEFRRWLKERYGTIQELNRRWNTTFWSHNYQNFDQVEPPSPRGEVCIHGLNLDWKRFVTDRTVDFARHEIQALRDAGSEKPVTTNMMYFFPGLNYHKFADVLDFISWDSYPVWHSQPEYDTAMDTAMYHDLMRSIQRKPFFLMESCPTSVNWQPVSKLKRPGLLEAASLQAIAHGADSVQYFQIRQSRGCSEKFHGAVIDHYGGKDTRVFREVTRTGEDLRSLTDLVGSVTHARTAVVYDWESRWAMEDSQGPRNLGLHYKDAVQKSYNAFRKAGFDVDVIDMEQSLEDYEVLAVPMAYMFRAGFEEKIRAFVDRGGILFMTYWSGIADETDLCFLGGTPHGLLDVLGLRHEEIDALYDGEKNMAVPVDGNPLGLTRGYSCEHLCDLVKVTDAQVLFTYGEDFYAGEPALTCHSWGEGMAYYICADMEQAFYDDVYGEVMRQRGILPPVPGLKIPDGVEVSTRESESAVYIFIQNFGKEEAVLELPQDLELIFGERRDRVPVYGTLVLARRF